MKLDRVEEEDQSMRKDAKMKCEFSILASKQGGKTEKQIYYIGQDGTVCHAFN